MIEELKGHTGNDALIKELEEQQEWIKRFLSVLDYRTKTIKSSGSKSFIEIEKLIEDLHIYEKDYRDYQKKKADTLVQLPSQIQLPKTTAIPSVVLSNKSKAAPFPVKNDYINKRPTRIYAINPDGHCAYSSIALAFFARIQSGHLTNQQEKLTAINKLAISYLKQDQIVRSFANWLGDFIKNPKTTNIPNNLGGAVKRLIGFYIVNHPNFEFKMNDYKVDDNVSSYITLI